MLARIVEEHEIDLQKLLRISNIKVFLYIEKLEIFLYESVLPEES